RDLRDQRRSAPGCRRERRDRALALRLAADRADGRTRRIDTDARQRAARPDPRSGRNGPLARRSAHAVSISVDTELEAGVEGRWDDYRGGAMARRTSTKKTSARSRTTRRSGGLELERGSGKVRSRGKPAPRWSNAKRRSVWFSSRTTWPLREA